jgi:hypothetical protein
LLARVIPRNEEVGGKFCFPKTTPYPVVRRPCLTIQMQHTIGRGTSKDDSNILEDVKSLFDEVKTRKDLISQLEELEDPSFKEEILTNKRRITEVSPIFN